MLVAGNAMAMSMRERTREVAVLKAIGFTRFIVLVLVLVEAIMIAMAGGIVGVLGAKLLVRRREDHRLPRHPRDSPGFMFPGRR